MPLIFCKVSKENYSFLAFFAMLGEEDLYANIPLPLVFDAIPLSSGTTI